MDTTLKRAFLRALVFSLCATAGLAIITLLFGEVDERDWKLLATATAFTGACAQASATTWRRRGDDSAALVRLYWTSLATGFGLAFLIVNAVWTEPEGEGYYRFLGALAVASLLVAVVQPIIRRMTPSGPERARE